MALNYKKYTQDAADRMVGRGDENQSIWVENLLTHTLNQLFLFRYPQTPFANGDLIQIDTSAPPGSVGVQWEMIGDVGLFDSVADEADDLPLIDIQGANQFNRAFTVAGSIRYTEQQLSASEMQGLFNIASEKGSAARRAYDRTLDGYIRSGSAKNSCPGLCNLPGRLDMPTTGAWSGLTPAQIVSDFQTAYGEIFNGTAGVFEPDTVVLPTTVKSIFKAQNSIAANVSIEGFLKETYPEITKWVYNYGMNTAGRGSTACMLMYNRDPSVCRALLPEFIRPLQVRPVNAAWVQPFHSRYAGILNTNPATVATMYGI